MTGNAVMAATEVLWALSGRQYGECTIADLRPCREECGITGSLFEPWIARDQWPYPALIGGRWFNLGCAGSCGSGCSCNTVSQFTLPLNVTRIASITVDGVVLDASAYQLYNFRHVVRTDGGEWPWCNNLSVTGGPGTWSVSVVVGDEVPTIGKMAVGELACQIIDLCCENDCELPVNARRVTRQGVTIDTPELTAIVATGSLGLRFVNEFLGFANPNQLQQRSRSYSPDTNNTWYPT